MLPAPLLLLLPTMLSCGVAHSSIVARVNGEPIQRTELEREIKRRDDGMPTPTAEKRALEALIRFHLGVQEAKRERLDQEPRLRDQWNEILYRSFVEGRLTGAHVALEPSDHEVASYYDTAPLLQLRELVLNAGDDNAREEAGKTAALIRKRLSQGVDFKKLVLEYAQGESAKADGDLGFRGVDELPPEIYTAALKLRVGDVSGDIVVDGALHLVQVIARKRYNDVPAPYREMLRSHLRTRREESYLSAIFDGLRKEAKIEIVKRPRTP